MSQTVKPLYGTETAITCNPDAVADGKARQSTVVDNTSNLFLDALVTVAFKTASGSLGTNPVVNVYVFSIGPNAAGYPDGLGASDAAGPNSSAINTPTNLLLARSLNVFASNTQYYSNRISVADFFGGRLPDKWGIVIENKTGLALGGTAGQAAVNYAYFLPVNLQAV